MEYREYLDDVSKIVSYNLGGAESVPKILNDWSINKKEFYEKFGQKTYVSSEEMEFKTDEIQAIRRLIDRFLAEAYSIFDRNQYYTFRAFERMCLNNEAVGAEGFKDNQIKDDWSSTAQLSYNGPVFKFEAKKGMRFSRALKTFFDTSKPEEEEKLKKLQNLYSTYRQKFANGEPGRVYLSIHPLDYLSISDNNHRWSSCHSMVDGEYRVGNLNYMADGATIVAYYTSNEEFDEYLEPFNDIKWNSKKWRMLIYVSTNKEKPFVIYSKQYPYSSDEMLDAVDKLVRQYFPELDENTEFREFFDDYPLYDRGWDSHAYIDLRNHNDNYVRVPKDINVRELEPITIGKAIYCLECGRSIAIRENDGLCEYCSDESACNHCGDFYHSDELTYVSSEGVDVCEYCLSEHYTMCDDCGEYCENNDISFIEEEDASLCPWCADNAERHRAERDREIELAYQRDALVV